MLIIAIVCPHVTDEQAQRHFGEHGERFFVAKHEQAQGGPFVLEHRETQEAKLLMIPIMSAAHEHTETALLGTQFTIKLIAPTGCACAEQEEKPDLLPEEKAALRISLANAILFLRTEFDQSTTFERWTFDSKNDRGTSLDHNNMTTTERVNNAST